MNTFDLSDPLRPTIEKHPDATLDYTWDWTSWLGSDTISSHEVTVDPDLSLGAVALQGNKVVAMISGGGTHMNATHWATCKVVTAGGRTDYRTIYLKIVRR